jgi:hypothetical protein
MPFKSIFLDKIGPQLVQHHRQKLVLPSRLLQKPVLEDLLNRLSCITLIARLSIGLLAFSAVFVSAESQRHGGQRQFAAEGAVEKEGQRFLDKDRLIMADSSF